MFEETFEMSVKTRPLCLLDSLEEGKLVNIKYELKIMEGGIGDGPPIPACAGE